MPDRDESDRFRSLFEAHFAYVWGVLCRLGVRASDAEDRTLEVFLEVHKKLAEYDDARPIRPWLFGFAYRVASHARRTEGRRREVFAVDVAVADPLPPVDERIADLQERSVLAAALEEIDLDRRAVLVMHDWDGEPIPEVARVLGIPLNTAYSRLRVGRAELQTAVKRISLRKGSR